MSKKRTSAFGLRGQSGNIIMILLVATASAAIISSALYSMLNRLDVMNRDTSRQQIYESAMTSLLNFTRAGVKRRWCFTDTWEQDSALTCDLTHPRSAERLLISRDELTHINQLIAINPAFPHASPIPLDSFQATVDLASLTSSHPIRKIVASHEFNFLGSIHFLVERMKDTDLPSSGSEVYMKITVDFIPKKGSVFPERRSRMTGWSKVAAYPREIGTFALIIPGDLYLGGTAKVKGDIGFPSGAAASAGTGLVFNSPVFVNGHINLPSAKGSGTVPVTFVSQVIQGLGIIKRDGAPFTTNQAGPLDATLSNLPGFGGFLAGVQVDGERDIGLDHFSGIVPTTAVDLSKMNACIKRNQLKTDLSITNGAGLVVRSKGSETWDLSWTKDDYFRSQFGAPGYSTSGAFNSVTVPPNDKPIMSVDVNFGSGASKVSNVQLPRDGELHLSPKVSSGPAPTVIISTSTYIANASPQDNIATFSVKIQDPGHNLVPFTIKINGYDVGVQAGANTRTAPNTYYPAMQLSYTKNSSGTWGASPTYSSSFGRADGASDYVAVNENWENLETSCTPANADPSLSFQASNWDVTFDMRNSWNLFPAPLLPLDASNTNSFNKFSIVDTCEIRSTTNLVAGFFVCDVLRIAPRSTPLDIIGTFIANRLDISATAMSAGIRWASIYNINSVLKLRDPSVKILKSASPTGSCDVDPKSPIWSPFKTVGQADDMLTCNSISLRRTFDNITWTTVDPDQGLDPAHPMATMRKNHPVRFVLMEYDRGFL